MTAGEPSYRLAELFGFLTQYVAEHFEAEERLMRETDYLGLAEQVHQHDDFKRRLHGLVPHWESEGGSTALLLALTGFLDIGLRDHIKSSDQRFADFMRGRRSSG
jgi:hemerythrin